MKDFLHPKYIAGKRFILIDCFPKKLRSLLGWIIHDSDEWKAFEGIQTRLDLSRYYDNGCNKKGGY